MLLADSIPGYLEHVRPPLLMLHIGGGLLGIIMAYVALLVRKGERIHRAAGKGFIVAMLVMASAALVMAIFKAQFGNITAAFITFYLITTGVLAVRRPEDRVGRYETFACALAFAIAAADFAVGLVGRSNPAILSGAPWQAAIVFGVIVTFAGLLDVRVILMGGLHGVARISRHLWRMSFAAFVASASFFLGQMKVIPHELRGPHLWVLAFFPLVALIFWMIRIRFRSALNPAPVAA